MSLRPMLWALYEAPVEDLPTGALRVLLMLADKAGGDDGTGAYPSKGTIADALRISSRSVQRHFDRLESAGLIRRGDQAIVSHYPGNRRPIVWDLVMVPEPVDNRVSPTDSGETPAVHSGETPAVHSGETPAVSQPHIEPPTNPPGAGAHPHESNVRRALAALTAAQGLDVEALVTLCYAISPTDPWPGYMTMRAELDAIATAGVRDRLAVLRHRLGLTRGGSR